MTDLQLLTQLVARLDRNQMAIQAGLEEVALWIGRQGDSDVSTNIKEAIQTLNDNAEFIAKGIAQLTVTTAVDGWRGGSQTTAE